MAKNALTLKEETLHITSYASDAQTNNAKTKQPTTHRNRNDMLKALPVQHRRHHQKWDTYISMNTKQSIKPNKCLVNLLIDGVANLWLESF